jgi:ubiquinone/menaquinone biosynthesis C-methylase UbiE
MEYLECVRRCELDLVLPLIPSGARVLEIGAGAGWQASALAENGFTVDAVDTEGSLYEQERIWPVSIYDGHVLPFGNESFDVVYSSSVLEHIAHVEEFQHEIQRVLKVSGLAIHVLPSASWRFWTNAAYYVHFLRDLKNSPTSLRAKFYTFRTNLRPPRHGEVGDSFTEIYTFSKRAWLKLFRAAGWTVVKTYTNRLFYTGYDTFNFKLPLRVRHLMSYLLGSACNIICLRKSAAAEYGQLV